MRRERAVLVSFGSLAESYRMPPTMKQAFLNAFHQFRNITFIWKYERDEAEIIKQHENLLVGKWLPQSDLLGNSFSLLHSLLEKITERIRFSMSSVVLKESALLICHLWNEQL